MRLRKALAVAVLSLLPAALLHAQFVESIEVSLANIDVVVVDRDGKPVRGLTKDDFEVLEDGKRQTITHFAEYREGVTSVSTPGADPVATTSPATPATTEAAAQAPARRQRLFALFVDIGEMDTAERRTFFDRIRKFLREEYRQGDLVSMLLWTTRIREVVPISDSIEEVHAVLTQFSGAQSPQDFAVFKRMAVERIAQRRGDAMALGGNAGDVDAEEGFDEYAASEFRCALIKRKFSSLQRLTASIAPQQDVQKVLIVASDDLALRPERSCLLQKEAEMVAATANAYGVTIHALHPPGVRDRFASSEISRPPTTFAPPLMATEAERTFGETAGLDLLAARTGGVFDLGRTSTLEALPKIADQLDNYYSLGYRLAPGRADEPRSVRVVTKNRNYRVRARQSVMMISADARLRDVMTASLYSQAKPEPKFPIEASLGEARNVRGNLHFTVNVKMPMSALTLLPTASGALEGGFSLWVTSGSELGDAADVHRQTKTIKLPAGVPAESQIVDYSFEMVVRRGTKRLALSIRDETTKEHSTIILTVPVVPGQARAGIAARR